MNKYLSLAVLASMMQFAHGAADAVVETPNAEVEGRVYVKPRAVRFMKKGIFVRTKNGTFATPAVSRDEQGLYVIEKDLVQAPEAAAKKRCGGCQNKGKWINKANDGSHHKGRGHHHWKHKVQNAQKPAQMDAQVEAQ